MTGALAYAHELAAQKAPPRKIRDISIDAGKLPAGFFEEAHKRIAKEKKNLFAPQRIVDALEAAATLPFDKGMLRERELFMQCQHNSQSKALQHVFFAERGRPTCRISIRTSRSATSSRVGDHRRRHHGRRHCHEFPECRHSGRAAGNDAGSAGSRASA